MLVFESIQKARNLCSVNFKSGPFGQCIFCLGLQARRYRCLQFYPSQYLLTQIHKRLFHFCFVFELILFDQTNLLLFDHFLCDQSEVFNNIVYHNH